MRDRSPFSILPGRCFLLLIGMACALLASLLALTACGSSAAATPDDPWARYRPALKPEFQRDLDDLGPVPRYDITAHLNVSMTQLTGSAQIVAPNTSSDPWTDVVFRLYPMLEQYGGHMTIVSALANGEPASFTYAADNTAVRVDLEKPLLPKQEVVINLTWRLDIPSWADQEAVYALFGRSQQMVSLPVFYPSLAVYEPGPTLGTGQWWLDEGGVRGDATFSQASLFAVTVTVPSAYVLVTSGAEVNATDNADGTTQHVYVTGPSREFLLHASSAFQALTGETYGTRVTSYYLPGQEAAARAALKYAQQSLAIYSDRYGEYPFTDMRVAPAPTSFRGMEYPQAMLLGVQLYGSMEQNLEVLVAHEMAHQWWYNIVGNDQVREPWLDESLAEYSMKLYMESMAGQNNADLFQVKRWQTPLQGLIGKGQDAAVDQPVASFANGSQYETVVYGKGALFYDKVRDSIGPRRFERFLHTYLEKYRWKVVDTSTWLNELRDLPDPTLVSLFAQMIQAPEVALQATQPTTSTISSQLP